MRFATIGDTTFPGIVKRKEGPGRAAPFDGRPVVATETSIQLLSECKREGAHPCYDGSVPTLRDEGRAAVGCLALRFALLKADSGPLQTAPSTDPFAPESHSGLSGARCLLSLGRQCGNRQIPAKTAKSASKIPRSTPGGP